MANNKLNSVYSKYKKSVNMNYSQLSNWANNPCSNKASIGRTAINRNLRLLSKNKNQWTNKDIKEANKTISFNARMQKMPNTSRKVPNCDMTKRDISLKNWALDVDNSKNSSIKSRLIDKYTPIELLQSGFINKKYESTKDQTIKPLDINEFKGKFDKKTYEIIPMSERDKKSIMDEYKKILSQMTPEQMNEQMKREKEAFDNLSPQERTHLFNANMEFLRQLNKDEQKDLMNINKIKIEEIENKKQDEFNNLVEKRRILKQRFKDKINTKTEPNLENFPLEDRENLNSIPNKNKRYDAFLEKVQDKVKDTISYQEITEPRPIENTELKSIDNIKTNR